MDDVMSQPKVSILLPTFSRFADGLLVQSVESALVQTWPNIELIVVDDGSTDGSAAYLSDLAARDDRVRHVRLERNIGLPALALAQGYEYATGEYIAWLFDDCELKPAHVETLVSALLEHPDWAMAYGSVNAELGEGAFERIGSPLDIEALARGNNNIPNVGVLMPRTTIDKFGWYDPHVLMKRLCDWDLWWRIAREAPIGFVDEVVAVEHGLRLTESLGRSNFVNVPLVLRYAITQRNGRLQPGRLTFDDAFRRDILSDATSAEELDLEYVMFEHALLTLDTARVEESLARLSVLEGSKDQANRFRIQHDRPATSDFEQLLVAAAGHVKRRTRSDVNALIIYEQLAAKRLEIVRAQAQEIESLREFGVTQLDTAKAAQDELRLAHAQISQLYEELRNSHALSDERLAIAEERLALLLEAQARLSDASRLADDRLAIADERLLLIERLQSQGRR
jgi:glycosyltransferase involved in cell wall biosynthesis